MNTLPMIIDSFAGSGGASTGIERALGRSMTDCPILFTAAMGRTILDGRKNFDEKGGE